MKGRQVPALALLLLRRLGGRYSESLEGDMLEEFAAGRSVFWCWCQVFDALRMQLSGIMRRRLMPFFAAALFFMVALWGLARVTAPVMDWARALEPMRLLVQLSWLAGVPFVLGGFAGAADRTRKIGAILLGAAFAYMTPITAPFDSAVCDVCVGPGSTAIPDAIHWLTPFCSALLAGLGAWIAAGLRRNQQEPQT
jgi:hypothetical protein